MQAFVHVLRQIDVADSLDLERFSLLLRDHGPTRGPATLRASPPSAAGVRLRHEPIDVQLGPHTVGPHAAELRLRAFDFGVVALRFTIAVPDASTSSLIRLATEIASQGALFDAAAQGLWTRLEGQVREAITPWDDPPPAPLIEDFVVFALSRAPAEGPDALAHVLLAEPATRPLAASVVQEVERRAIRYYEDDLVAVDDDAAIVVEPRGSALELVDIFEVASAQLLELRFYDAHLGRALSALARDVRPARATTWLLHSPFSRLSQRAARLALELGEITDRLERSITLVGDSHSVQVYREAAARFRIPEARTSVREKAGMITTISEALGSDVQGRRALAVELMIVILIVFEVVFALLR